MDNPCKDINVGSHNKYQGELLSPLELINKIRNLENLLFTIKTQIPIIVEQQINDLIKKNTNG